MDATTQVPCNNGYHTHYAIEMSNRFLKEGKAWIKGRFSYKDIHEFTAFTDVVENFLKRFCIQDTVKKQKLERTLIKAEWLLKPKHLNLEPSTIYFLKLIGKDQRKNFSQSDIVYHLQAATKLLNSSVSTKDQQAIKWAQHVFLKLLKTDSADSQPPLPKKSIPPDAGKFQYLYARTEQSDNPLNQLGDFTFYDSSSIANKNIRSLESTVAAKKNSKCNNSHHKFYAHLMHDIYLEKLLHIRQSKYHRLSSEEYSELYQRIHLFLKTFDFLFFPSKIDLRLNLFKVRFKMSTCHKLLSAFVHRAVYTIKEDKARIMHFLAER
ncbi:MAG: hypothetical protein JHC93_07440 [Parachlamydiales bacterium]|nr:hypothetical protein [Parachlamydiales bacterium]